MKTREGVINKLLVENQHFKLLHDCHRELDQEITDNYDDLKDFELKDKKHKKLLMKEEMEDFITEELKKKG